MSKAEKKGMMTEVGLVDFLLFLTGFIPASSSSASYKGTHITLH